MEVRKRRASGAAGVRFAVQPVERDEAGSWFLAEASTPHVRDEGWVEYLSPNPVLLLIPHAERWVASTSATGAKVDLCSLVSVDDERVEFVDVELDVVWCWGEPARIDDVEEFEALGLPAEDAAGHLAEAERIRRAVDARTAPLGPAFRERLLGLVGPVDPRLAATWAAGAGPGLAGRLAALVGDEWLDRQRAGAGWMLCGGNHDIAAVVWIDRAGGQSRLIAAEDTPAGEAMGSFLLAAVPGVDRFAVPPVVAVRA